MIHGFGTHPPQINWKWEESCRSVLRALKPSYQAISKCWDQFVNAMSMRSFDTESSKTDNIRRSQMIMKSFAIQFCEWVSRVATARCQISDWKEGSAAKGGSGLHTQAILLATMDRADLPNYQYLHSTIKSRFQMYSFTIDSLCICNTVVTTVSYDTLWYYPPSTSLHWLHRQPIVHCII